VELACVGALHAAFLNESRTRGLWWRLVQEIRIRAWFRFAVYFEFSRRLFSPYVKPEKSTGFTGCGKTHVLYQGTTLVVPTLGEMMRALAPEVLLSCPVQTFSAAPEGLQPAPIFNFRAPE
jgi:hypothetical protein